MKKYIALVTLLVLLLIVRLCVADVVSVPEGRCPRAGGWTLVNRWAYGYRLPWNAASRWNYRTADVGDWLTYNRPVLNRQDRPDTTSVCIGHCAAAPGDTLWYNNETGRIGHHRDRRNGFLHPLIVPARHEHLRITNDNLRFYAITIMLHEPVKASIVNDSLCVSGRIVSEYTFQQDYYWISTDDPKNLLDSRSFGFVPHASLIGKIL